jgi:hypothetical protein
MSYQVGRINVMTEREANERAAKALADFSAACRQAVGSLQPLCDRINAATESLKPRH